MSFNSQLSVLRTGFSSTFWIANTLELFERLAFYGMKAVLVVFIAEKVGLKDEAGTLAGWFTTLVYFLPIFAGVLVDIYGFRRTLIACFAIFGAGYFFIALAGMEWGQEIVDAVGRRAYIITMLIFTAVGGSLIKPCIVGTVARTSKKEAQTLGFSIYYSLVNFGGAIGPLIAAEVRVNFGIEHVVLMSSLTCFLLLLGTIFFFKEPEAAEGEKRTVGKVISDMFIVFGNMRFMSFLLIFSAFWIMFWQVFYLLPFYAIDILHYEKFERLEAIDAISIIFFSLFMGTMFKSWRPFTAMIFGIVVASLSWLIIGLWGTTAAVVVGIALFGFGEGTMAPRFYEYVNSLAPKDQVGTYMGFAFLPVAIGALAAGYVSDWLRNTYMDTNPATMWYILSGVGAGCLVLVVIYDKVVAAKKHTT
jgi:dipeptide/tripeptide permease